MAENVVRSEANRPARARMSTVRRQEFLAGLLLAAPALILLITFMIVPSLMSVSLSFTNQRLVGPLTPSFVGLDNFRRLLEDDTFWQSLRNNLYFTGVVVPLQSAFALFLAILTNQKVRGVNFFRTIYFSPIATTMVVVAIIWTLLFNTQGLINSALSGLTAGAAPQFNWLDDPRLAMPAVIIMSIWQSVGFQMVIFLAGLQEIPDYLYEAAKVDGATAVQRFFYITIPSLRNTIIFVLVSTTILSFRLFTQVEVMTQGGPRGATNTMVRHMIETGFGRLQIGYASAISVAFLVIVLGVSILQRRLIPAERM
jgi:multiple sugar transport system permease protein